MHREREKGGWGGGPLHTQSTCRTGQQYFISSLRKLNTFQFTGYGHIQTLPFNSFRCLTHFCIELHDKQLDEIIYWNLLRTLLEQDNQSGCAEDIIEEDLY